MSDPAEVGVIGLGVMGTALARNFASRGLVCAGWDQRPSAVAALEALGEPRLIGCTRLFDLVAHLRRPRTLLLMVQAGVPVDDVLGALLPHLSPGDRILDGGNSLYVDTSRRCAELSPTGIAYYGVGVSGGEEGARHGPSLMVGGPEARWPELRELLARIAAVTESGPCVARLGPEGAGHFVKMVHNGIEYADMQLLAEAYHLLSDVGGLGAPALADVFEAWNAGPLESFLIGITSRIFQKRDQHNKDHFLVDKVLDQAGQKGTGRWTAETALELGVAVPTISAAVDARVLSSLKPVRVRASAVLRGPETAPQPDRDDLIRDLHDALLASRITAYAQGLFLIREGSARWGWGIDPTEVLRVWTGGCILRSRLVRDAIVALRASPGQPSLMLHPAFADQLEAAQRGWRRTLGTAVTHGIPVPALSASLAYYDSFRLHHLPHNLIQAQRDAFGAHQYVRADDPDARARHSNWTVPDPTPPPRSRRGE